MTRKQMERAVAGATREWLREIRRRGFHIAAPNHLSCEPDLEDRSLLIIDCDEFADPQPRLFPSSTTLFNLRGISMDTLIAIVVVIAIAAWVFGGGSSGGSGGHHQRGRCRCRM